MGWKKAANEEPPAKARRRYDPWIVSGYYDFKYDMAAFFQPTFLSPPEDCEVLLVCLSFLAELLGRKPSL